MQTVNVAIDFQIQITEKEREVLDRLIGLYGEDMVDGVLSDIICMMVQDKFQIEGTETLIGEVESMCEAYGEVENA